SRPRRCPWPPGGTSSLHLLSSGLTPLFRNRSVPSRRASLHVGPLYLAISLYSTSLRRPAAVVRNRRDVLDLSDSETDRVQCANRGFPARSRPLHAHLEILHAEVLGGVACPFGGHLRRERRALTRALEAAPAGRRPGERVPLTIRDRHDRVVERRMDVRDGIENLTLDLLSDARGRGRLFRHTCS